MKQSRVWCRKLPKMKWRFESWVRSVKGSRMGLDMFRGRGVPMGRALYLGNCWRIDMAMFIVGVVVGRR